ncbi:MAG: hypothetical protein DMF61_00800 [Blastocatellia bacterium AA13]|nr:MAG: hypothetical protein DMF61_00800 [Blastocatellia bacterium AA13]
MTALAATVMILISRGPLIILFLLPILDPLELRVMTGIFREPPEKRGRIRYGCSGTHRLREDNIQ